MVWVFFLILLVTGCQGARITMISDPIGWLIEVNGKFIPRQKGK
jgi:hypothetical protein